MSQRSQLSIAGLLSRSLLTRWKANKDGTTAIEFALVAVPFLMLLYGIIGVGLFFFTTFTIENAVEQASRFIRTGQAQQAGWSPQDFKNKVCEFVPSHIDCVGKVRVNVKSYASSASITPASLPQCLNGGGLNNSNDYVPGTANVIVLVWACYEWDFAQKIPYFNLGDMGNGSRLIQATTTFRTEPYSGS